MLGEKTHAFTVVHSEDPAMFEAEYAQQIRRRHHAQHDR